MTFIFPPINVCITLFDLYSEPSLGTKETSRLIMVCESFNAVLKLICQAKFKTTKMTKSKIFLCFTASEEARNSIKPLKVDLRSEEEYK